MVECEFENGSKARLRHVTTSVIVLGDDDEVLLTKRAPHLTEGDKWAMPGGYLDLGEDAAAGARRECLEETGHLVEDLELFAVITSPTRRNDERQNVEFLFSGRAGERSGEPDDESTAIEWFPADAVDLDSLAFDHGRNLGLFFDHLKSPRSLPLIY